MIVESAEQLPLYLHYIAARQYLAEKLGATPQEIAMWVWLGDDVEPVAGTKSVGLRAYRNAAQCTHVPVPSHLGAADPDDADVADDDRTIPERFHFSDWLVATSTDYQLELLGAYFLRSDLEAFDPEERYIGYDDLRTRWAKHLPEAEAGALIRELAKSDADLPTYHPITGGALSERIVAASEDDLWGLVLPAIETCIFSMNDVESVEANVFTLVPVEPVVMATPNVDSEAEQLLVTAADARASQGDAGDRTDSVAKLISERDANLARGRAAANAARMQEALEKAAKVEKGIEDLIENYPNGLSLPDDDILRFLKPRLKELGYADATLLRKVKKIADRERAKVKETVPGLARP